MKSNIIGILILLINCSLVLSQNTTDTTKFVFRNINNDYNKAIEYCIDGFKKWNVENNSKEAVVLIHTSFDENNELTLYVDQAWNLPIDDHLPDYYSYAKGAVIFWYLGESMLTTQTLDLRKFLLNRFPKVFYSSKEKSISTQNKILNKSKNKISLEEWNRLSPLSDSINVPSDNKILFYPSYVIKIKKQTTNLVNRKIIIDRLEKNIYK